MESKQKDRILFVSIIILIIIHTVGLFGILSSYSSFFLSLTPVNLLLSFFLLLLNQSSFRWWFYLFFLLTFIIGFASEIIGVNTGFIFGEYSYSKILGVQLFNVPVIIGLNWVMLVFTVGCICHHYKANIFVKSLAGAMLLVILDFFLESVAMKYNFWIWKNGKVPLQNYLAWFLLSFILLLFFNKSIFYKNNRLTKPFYLIQLIFFILLTIL